MINSNLADFLKYVDKKMCACRAREQIHKIKLFLYILINVDRLVKLLLTQLDFKIKFRLHNDDRSFQCGLRRRRRK